MACSLLLLWPFDIIIDIVTIIDAIRYDDGRSKVDITQINLPREAKIT